MPQGKLCEITRSRAFFYNKLRTVKVTILILLLNQVSEVEQDLKATPFFQLLTSSCFSQLIQSPFHGSITPLSLPSDDP